MDGRLARRTRRLRPRPSCPYSATTRATTLQGRRQQPFRHDDGDGASDSTVFGHSHNVGARRSAALERHRYIMSAASRRELAATHYTHGIHSTHLVRRELCLQSDCRATHTADSHDRIIPCRSDAQSTFYHPVHPPVSLHDGCGRHVRAPGSHATVECSGVAWITQLSIASCGPDSLHPHDCSSCTPHAARVVVHHGGALLVVFAHVRCSAEP